MADGGVLAAGVHSLKDDENGVLGLGVHQLLKMGERLGFLLKLLFEFFFRVIEIIGWCGGGGVEIDRGSGIDTVALGVDRDAHHGTVTGDIVICR